jgi:hypothetical protein
MYSAIEDDTSDDNHTGIVNRPFADLFTESCK